MQERRQTERARVIYGATVTYNQKQSTLDCVVQNYSESGAKIVLENPSILPDTIDVLINRKGRAYSANIVWRSADEAGLSFLPQADSNAPVPLDWARRLRDCEADRRALQSQIRQLTSGR